MIRWPSYIDANYYIFLYLILNKMSYLFYVWNGVRSILHLEIASDKANRLAQYAFKAVLVLFIILVIRSIPNHLS